MTNTAKARAEIALAATRTIAREDHQDKDAARRARTEQMEKLRALRLAKEAADKLAAERSPAAAAKPLRLPQAHRRQC